jgi:hypothetical protein
MTILPSEEASKYPDLLEKCNKEDNKALEIKQIECKQRMIAERLIHLELQKKRLQDCLNALQASNSDDDDDEDDDDGDDEDQNA